MHYSSIGHAEPSIAFLEFVGALALPEQRQEAADARAGLLGGDHLLLFGVDPELNISVPAPGLPQVLRGATEWQEFIAAAASNGECSGLLPGLDGQPMRAFGCALKDGTAAVLLGAADAGNACRFLQPLLPLLGAVFRGQGSGQNRVGGRIRGAGTRADTRTRHTFATQASSAEMVALDRPL